MRALLVLACALALAGCKADPYCLNCTDSGGGDLPPTMDLSGVDFTTPPDLTSNMTADGGCIPTNGGVEICDGLDNDCNGHIDDVPASKLASDPNNCGACGTVCNYAATHQFGACTSSMCAPSGCVAGYVDADHDPANGCEYRCAPSNGGVEICNGVDDDCNGIVDDGYTATYAPDGTPSYDSDVANCGGCGFACNLPGAVNKCGPNAMGRGTCEVASCNNTPGVDTYKHDPDNGDINTTGCEYHCPTPSSTSGDCNAAGNSCTFPAEVCNGIDDDCNFHVDDNPTDPDLGTPCGSKCPGALVANCKGQCTAGTTICNGGVKLCSGGTGPGPELCDGVDNNCDGFVDEPYTAPGPSGYAGGNPSMPLYNTDPNNCGHCGPGPKYTCNLAHALNGCHSATANAQGNCYVVSCNSGFNYVSNTDSSKSAPTCNVPTTGTRDALAGDATTGVGCFYSCATGFFPPLTTCSGCVPAPSESVCDGQDNNCDGCIDDIATKPAGLCSTTGVCAGLTVPVQCKGVSGWKCNYAGLTNVDADASGNLATIETKCDGLDNNCNGFCDENFPTTATGPAPACLKNPNRAATACTAGQGLCARSGTFCCGTSAGTCQASAAAAVCSTTPDLTKAQDEACNGVDDNCNGLVDDANAANGKLGYHDPTVQVAIPAGDTSLLGNPAAHTVYVYPYEAARPDATAASEGGLSNRACAKSGVQPWASVTNDEASAACYAAGGRLCTQFEFQTTCEGPTVAAPPDWSYSTATNTYATGVCNDVNRTAVPALWTTGHGPVAGTETCSSVWLGGSVSDLSGNLSEWTLTPVLFASLAGGAAASVTSSGTAGRMKLGGMSGLTAAGAVAGQVITLTGATSNNGTFAIVTVIDDTSVIVTDNGFPAAGGTDAKNGTITWSLVNTYYQTPGGNFRSPQGGTTCEFEFDIAKPGFADDDLGFRCCFDAPP